MRAPAPHHRGDVLLSLPTSRCGLAGNGQAWALSLRVEAVGNDVPLTTEVFAAKAMALNTQLNTPSFGVTSMLIGTSPGSEAYADLPMPNFYYVAQGISANVVVTYS